MSVTFTVLGSEVTTITSVCYCVDEGKADPYCQFCDGSGKEEESFRKHSHNFANSNAVALLGALGLDTEELQGSLTGDQLASVRQRAMVALNSPKRRSTHLREGVTGTTRGATSTVDNVVQLKVDSNYFAKGLDDDGLLIRLEMIDELLEVAQNRNTQLIWS